MSKQKFQIGDEVYVKRGRKNEIGRVGKITNICKYGGRLGYIVKYNDNDIFPKSGAFYADMLLFSNMHSIAEHLVKGGELPKLSRNELEEMKQPDFKFKKGDFVKLKEAIDETESVIGKVIDAVQVKNIRSEIKNSYIIEFLSGVFGGYPEDKLTKYDQRIEKTTKAPQNEVRRCKYCDVPFDEIPESKSESGVCEYCEEKQTMISEIKIKKSASVDLHEFSVYGQEYDWLEVTEWSNGEGIDIIIESKEPTKNISLTYDELEAIINIVNKFGTLPPIYTKNEIEN